MSRHPAKENLPEPAHPFARWCAGAAIGLWALGVQSLSDPWNKIGAIVSPGVGYLLGQTLDYIIYHASRVNFRLRHEKALLNNKKTIDNLYKERQDAIAVGAGSEIVQSIDAMLVYYQKARIEMIAQVPGASDKGSKGRRRAV
jgi:hypothetical protein